MIFCACLQTRENFNCNYKGCWKKKNDMLQCMHGCINTKWCFKHYFKFSHLFYHLCDLNSPFILVALARQCIHVNRIFGGYVFFSILLEFRRTPLKIVLFVCPHYHGYRDLDIYRKHLIASMIYTLETKHWAG